MWVIACQSLDNGTFRNISRLNTNTTGLLPSVVRTLVCIACWAIDNALSKILIRFCYIFLEDLHVIKWAVFARNWICLRIVTSSRTVLDIQDCANLLGMCSDVFLSTRTISTRFVTIYICEWLNFVGFAYLNLLGTYRSSVTSSKGCSLNYHWGNK